MVMDYLPIQATSVPCERVFSSSAETDTKRRNHITSPLMEALQILKFWFKKECLDFMHGWMTDEKQLVEDDPDADLLQTLINQDTQSSQNNFDNLIRSMDD
jgi:hypothetical protein